MDLPSLSPIQLHIVRSSRYGWIPHGCHICLLALEKLHARQTPRSAATRTDSGAVCSDSAPERWNTLQRGWLLPFKGEQSRTWRRLLLDLIRKPQRIGFLFRFSKRAHGGGLAAQIGAVCCRHGVAACVFSGELDVIVDWMLQRPPQTRCSRPGTGIGTADEGVSCPRACLAPGDQAANA